MLRNLYNDNYKFLLFFAIGFAVFLKLYTQLKSDYLSNPVARLAFIVSTIYFIYYFYFYINNFNNYNDKFKDFYIEWKKNKRFQEQKENPYIKNEKEHEIKTLINNFTISIGILFGLCFVFMIMHTIISNYDKDTDTHYNSFQYGDTVNNENSDSKNILNILKSILYIIIAGIIIRFGIDAYNKFKELSIYTDNLSEDNKKLLYKTYLYFIFALLLYNIGVLFMMAITNDIHPSKLILTIALTILLIIGTMLAYVSINSDLFSDFINYIDSICLIIITITLFLIVYINLYDLLENLLLIIGGFTHLLYVTKDYVVREWVPFIKNMYPLLINTLKKYAEACMGLSTEDSPNVFLPHIPDSMTGLKFLIKTSKDLIQSGNYILILLGFVIALPELVSKMLALFIYSILKYLIQDGLFNILKLSIETGLYLIVAISIILWIIFKLMLKNSLAIFFNGILLKEMRKYNNDIPDNLISQKSKTNDESLKSLTSFNKLYDNEIYGEALYTFIYEHPHYNALKAYFGMDGVTKGLVKRFAKGVFKGGNSKLPNLTKLTNTSPISNLTKLKKINMNNLYRTLSSKGNIKSKLKLSRPLKYFKTAIGGTNNNVIQTPASTQKTIDPQSYHGVMSKYTDLLYNNSLLKTIRNSNMKSHIDSVDILLNLYIIFLVLVICMFAIISIYYKNYKNYIDEIQYNPDRYSDLKKQLNIELNLIKGFLIYIPSIVIIIMIITNNN